LKRALSLLALAVLALAACNRAESPKATPATERYRLVADEATLPLLRALADAYGEVNPYAQLTVEVAGQSRMSEALQSGQAAVAASSVMPAATAANAPWWRADLALDGVSVIVHSQNPVSGMTTRDVRDVFAGIRNQWEQLGAGGTGNIEVAVREDGDGSREVFEQTVMGDQRLTFDALVMPSIETMLNYVALKPGAIGYAPSASVARQPGVKAIPIDGKAATPATLGLGEYSLSRTLSLLATREPQGELRNFVAWALGPRGKSIAESLGYAALN
jgi:phosphate transport system substrate-binding protein